MTEQYAGPRSQIMLLDPLLDINRVFSLIVQQECQMSKDMEEESEVLSNVNVRAKKVFAKNNSNTGKGKMCSHYGKGGHTVEVCYKKHGYLRGFKVGQKSKGSAPSSVNQVSTKDPDEVEEQDPDQESQRSLSDVFTLEQYQALLALLQQNHATVVNHITSTVPSTSRAGFSNHFVSNFISRSQSWILDSGATNHVCCSLSHFFFL